jgi:hypothetical protein
MFHYFDKQSPYYKILKAYWSLQREFQQNSGYPNLTAIIIDESHVNTSEYMLPLQTQSGTIVT